MRGRRRREHTGGAACVCTSLLGDTRQEQKKLESFLPPPRGRLPLGRSRRPLPAGALPPPVGLFLCPRPGCFPEELIPPGSAGKPGPGPGPPAARGHAAVPGLSALHRPALASWHLGSWVPEPRCAGLLTRRAAARALHGGGGRVVSLRQEEERRSSLPACLPAFAVVSPRTRGTVLPTVSSHCLCDDVGNARNHFALKVKRSGLTCAKTLLNISRLGCTSRSCLDVSGSTVTTASDATLT